ncbi:RNA 2',3'-cyclic phosphodiesterase [Fictibacillus sp. NRS-1165]|uniref:RNA 2',3'-cyclic phosphodiesterase n=1 Tax=Fictibacillus sp. NRS-1165 TaxID=3144463 RepID=UPI003D1B528C
MSRHVFAAVPIPSDVKCIIGELSGTLQENLPFKQWVHQEDLHLTLAFLGKTQQDKLIHLKSLFHDHIQELPSFSLTVTGAGFFGKKSQPRVFWLGVEEEERLFALQKMVNRLCQQAGFQLESRPYSPHITLAKRWGDTDARIDVVFDESMTKPAAGISFDVPSIVLYETHLDKDPKYHVIEEFCLKGEDSL